MQTEITVNINVLSLDRLFGGSHAIITQARAMEDANIDGIVAPDHVVFGTGVEYPFGKWVRSKAEPGAEPPPAVKWTVDPAETWPEPMSILSAAAAVTRRVDLVTNVLVAPLRSAPLLAKQVATLFELSEGRFQLGVGTGWQKEEFEASGIPFETRSDYLFDQMGACRKLWHDRPATFTSKHVTLDKIWCAPGLPDPQTGRSLPLWFGVAPVAANARFFAEFDGGWSCIYPDPKFIAKGRAILQTALKEQFGITRPLRIRAAPQVIYDANGAPSVERTIENLPASIAAGVTEFDFPTLLMVKEAAKFEPFIKALGRIERRLDRYPAPT